MFLFISSQQKLWELAKQVSEFLVWRQVVCPFDRDRRILQYLVTTAVLSEDGQWAEQPRSRSVVLCFSQPL